MISDPDYDPCHHGNEPLNCEIGCLNCGHPCCCHLIGPCEEDCGCCRFEPSHRSDEDAAQQNATEGASLEQPLPLSNGQVAALLHARKVRLYHAIDLPDFETYCERWELLSRAELEAHPNGIRVRFYSDDSDKDRGLSRRVFGNLHNYWNYFWERGQCPNAYGHIVLEFRPEVFLECNDISLTPSNAADEAYNVQTQRICREDCLQAAIEDDQAMLKRLELSCANPALSLCDLDRVVVQPYEGWRQRASRRRFSAPCETLPAFCAPASCVCPGLWGRIHELSRSSTRASRLGTPTAGQRTAPPSIASRPSSALVFEVEGPRGASAMVSTGVRGSGAVVSVRWLTNRWRTKLEVPDAGHELQFLPATGLQ